MFRKATSIPYVRLATQLAGFGVAVVLVVLLAAYFTIVHSERSSAFRRAEALADAIVPALAAGGAVPAGEAWVLPSSGSASGNPPPAGLTGLDAGHHAVRVDGRAARAIVRGIGDGRLALVVYDETPHVERLSEVARSLAAIGAFLVVATLLISSWWASLLLRYDPHVRQRVSQQMRVAAARALRGKDETSSTLARTYTEYVRLLYDPDERTREFMANVGHELRTPITLVRTGCEVLTTIPDLSQRHRRRIAQMIAALDHMSETVRSFMILAREGDFGPANQVRIADIFSEIMALNAVEARERGMTFDVHAPEPCNVEVNREALMIAVGNLVRNAIRHAGVPGRITLSFEAGRISVADAGPGISHEDHSRIFMPFYRARRAAEEGTFGLGLGLAIVKRVSDFYGWKVDVSSRHGQGTVFTIDLDSR